MGEEIKELRILMVEDSETDADLVIRELRKGALTFASRRVEKQEDYLKAIETNLPDLILSDNSLPSFDGLSALRIAREKCPEVPFIFVSGTIGEEVAIETLKAGATDYVIKDRLSRLVPVIERALREVEERQQKRLAEKRLLESEKRYRSLFEEAPIAYFTIGTDRSIRQVNSAATRLLGYSQDELLQMELFDLYYDNQEGLSREQEFFDRFIRGEYIDDEELMMRRRDGEPVWVSFTVRPVRDEQGTIVESRAMVKNTTERKQAQDELAKSFKKLRKTMNDTIFAMALTIESRDAYTAGHQQRVALLACAIAEELGLPADQVEGLHMGAIVHDIGKISVPAQILSKPGKLLKAEFELIITHPKLGYDILKGIDFPWPVANMVRQHHERIDGTGYPDGLKNEEIIIEAKILAVADVVEAMSSHRPYRPSMGVEKALQYIRMNSGVLFDAGVVSACETVFEGGFAFEERKFEEEYSL
jgi:PAS domain S-box-containing protein/putative nucleotidyltransferase with HDIG domain